MTHRHGLPAAGPAGRPSSPDGVHPRLGTIALVCLFIAAALVLLYEQRSRALGPLPWVLILACPLMYFVGHRARGAHSGHPPPEGGDDPATPVGDPPAPAAHEEHGWRAPSPWARSPDTSPDRLEAPLGGMRPDATPPARPRRLP